MRLWDWDKFSATILMMLALIGCVAHGNSKNQATIYESSDHIEKNHQLTLLSEQGEAKDQNNLGVMYARGWGVSQDYTEAMRWYRKAAEQGYANAQYNLGTMYDNGQGVPQSYAEAMRWYRKAADTAKLRIRIMP